MYSESESEPIAANSCGHCLVCAAELQGCAQCKCAVRRSVRQTVVRDKQMKALGMAGGREIDPSKATDSLCDI